MVGCPPGIRTPIDRFRADCSTIELGGKVLSVVRCRVANRVFADCLLRVYEVREIRSTADGVGG